MYIYELFNILLRICYGFALDQASTKNHQYGKDQKKRTVQREDVQCRFCNLEWDRVRARTTHLEEEIQGNTQTVAEPAKVPFRDETGE